MSKLFLTGFLVAPLLVAGSIWFMIDKDGSRRLKTITAIKAEAAARGEGPAPAVLAGNMMSHSPATVAATAAGAAATAVGDDKKDAPKTDGAKMVRPEFLPQGYIIRVIDKTGLSSPSSPVFVAGSYNGWNPSDEKYKMQLRSDMAWELVLGKAVKDAPMEFKFTRGSWDREMLTADLTVPANMMLPEVDSAKYPPGGELPIFTFEVVKWGDQRPSMAGKVDGNPYFEVTTPNVRRLEVSGGTITPFKRDLLVWLPPGYNDAANKDRRYPVLYLQDGQNLFQKHPGIPSEWNADETAEKLIKEGKVEPMIIVGVPHAGAARMSEYIPFATSVLGDAKPAGDWYAQWLVETIMPRVNRAFRTKTGAENTMIGGASLGAVISLHTAVKYPGTFGGLLLESISPLSADNATLKFFANTSKLPGKIFYGFGTKEGDDKPETQAAYTKLFNETGAWLKERAGSGVMMMSGDTPHSETAWADRFDEALIALFGK
jgi:predicted alpha/beta superfamily hydrolase